MNKSCILVFVILFVPFLILADLPKLNLPKLDKKATKLPPCKLCSALVASFVKVTSLSKIKKKKKIRIETNGFIYNREW